MSVICLFGPFSLPPRAGEDPGCDRNNAYLLVGVDARKTLVLVVASSVGMASLRGNLADLILGTIRRASSVIRSSVDHDARH